MKQYYSNDNGATWEGPLSDTAIDALRSAGIITPSTLLRAEESSAALELRQAEPTPPPAPDDAFIYLMILGEQRGPFTREQVQDMLSTKQITRETLMWCNGMANWGTVGQEFSVNMPGTGTFASLTGLENFRGFSFTRFFGDIFKRHSNEELTDFFCCGSRLTTPRLEEITPAWPSPWIFSRLFALTLILFFGFAHAIDRFDNSLLIPGWLFIGNFGIPFCILVLMMELNIERQISFSKVLFAFLQGGLLSLIFSLFLFKTFETTEIYWAGPIEEAGKLLAAIMIGRKYANGRVLTGMLFGVAVGAGFEAFENFGYTFVALFEGDGSHGIETMLGRALTAPLTHAVWTAITAGAFWLAMGKSTLVPGAGALQYLHCLGSKVFLRIAWIPVVCHMLWNGFLPLLGGYPNTLRSLILGVIAWLVALLLVQAGINQIKTAKQTQA